MRYLVTGGAGFIGSHIVKRLAEQKHKVYVLDNFHTGSMDNLENIPAFMVVTDRNVRDYSFDIQFDGIFHFGIPSSTPMYRDNPMLMGQTINEFIHLIKNTNCKIVFASSSSVYNGCKPPFTEEMGLSPTDFYTETRIAMERLAELYKNLENRKIVALRLFSVYGDHEEAKGRYANMVTQILWDILNDRNPVIYGDGTQTRDFTYVDDVAHAAVVAMEHFDSGIYNVGTGISYSFNDVIKMLSYKLNKIVKATYITNPLQNYVQDTKAGTHKLSYALERILPWQPLSLDRGLDKIIEYYKM